MSIKTLNALLLAGVLSLVAVSAAQAGRAGGSGTEVRAAPACRDKCPVLAGGGVRTGDPRSSASLGDTGRSGQAPALWRPVLASDGPPGVGEGNGRRMAS